MGTKRKTPRIHVIMGRDLQTAVWRVGVRNNWSASEVICKATEEFVEKHGDKVRPPKNPTRRQELMLAKLNKRTKRPA